LRNSSSHTTTPSLLPQLAEGNPPVQLLWFTADTYTSQPTLDRIKTAQIISFSSDEAFVAESDIILSIVPPRDAVATARRVVDASRSSTTIKQRAGRENIGPMNEKSLIYIDLNAISAKTAKLIEQIITSEASPAAVRRRSSSFAFTSPPPVKNPLVIGFLDGGIIGGPPSQAEDGHWKTPSLVVSGPKLNQLLSSDLRRSLNIKDMGPTIGPASSLKCCFAALSKGSAALAILSYTTAHTCGVLPELRKHLKQFVPDVLAQAEGSLVGMGPKAYRWVDEMRQIGETFGEEGGFSGGLGGQAIFEGVAEVYKLIAEDTVLGEEKIEKRKRSRNVEDVASCVAEGVKKRRRGSGVKDEDLSLAWRGSWS
jgi:Domain of unknown function (DUF1932)